MSPAVAVAASRLAGLLAEPPAFGGPDPAPRPAYAALAAAIRTLAVDGRLPPAVRLPSERQLAVAIGASRTTVTRAYGALVESGWARARQGSGTFLTVPGDTTHAASPLVPLPGVNLDLTAAAVSCVPGTAALVERALADLPALLRGPGYEPAGLPVLRETIAARYTARGLPTSADQVVVTVGAMAAIAVVIRAVARRGDRALVESPTYPTALGALRAAGVRPAVAPGDGESPWHLPTVASVLRAGSPRLGYLVPEFHNPTGHLMADEVRAALAHAFGSAGTVVLVDESLVDLDLDGVTAGGPAPFAAHLPEAFSVGSVSKPLWGGVRVGWVRCPAGQVQAVRSARLTLDLGPSALDQLVAAAFLSDPEPILAPRLAGLREMREAWLSALASAAPGWETRRPAGGLGLWVRLPARVAPDLAAAARGQGIALAVGPQFTTDGSARDRLRLPLTATVPDVPGVVEVLVRCFDEVTDAAGRPAGRAARAAAPQAGRGLPAADAALIA